MATLSELRTRILAKVDDGDIQDPSSQEVTDQINLTIDYYENNSFWFSEGVADLTTTIGDPVLDISSVTDFKQFIQPNSIVITFGNVRYSLEQTTPLLYDEINVDSIGLPRWFTYRNGQIELAYYPDKAYDTKLYYRKNYPDLTDDNDTNDFLTYTERLIEYKALADILFDYRSDFERSARYEQKAQDEFNKIMTETYQRTSTGELSTENITNRSDGFFYFSP